MSRNVLESPWIEHSIIEVARNSDSKKDAIRTSVSGLRNPEKTRDPLAEKEALEYWIQQVLVLVDKVDEGEYLSEVRNRVRVSILTNYRRKDYLDYPDEKEDKEDEQEEMQAQAG